MKANTEALHQLHQWLLELIGILEKTKVGPNVSDELKQNVAQILECVLRNLTTNPLFTFPTFMTHEGRFLPLHTNGPKFARKDQGYDASSTATISPQILTTLTRISVMHAQPFWWVVNIVDEASAICNNFFNR